MKIGGEKKLAVWALSVLGGVAAYGVYSNFFSGSSVAPAPSAKVRAVDAIPEAVAAPDAGNAKAAPQRTAVRAQSQEFRPVLRPKKKEDQIVDIRTVDPTIRLDLLAQVQRVPQAGGERDLFQILKAPPVHEAALKGEEPHVHRRHRHRHVALFLFARYRTRFHAQLCQQGNRPARSRQRTRRTLRHGRHPAPGWRKAAPRRSTR